MREGPSLPPWRYEKSEQGFTIYGMWANDNERLAEVYETKHGEGEDNARLMALSREVYEVLSDVLYFWGTNNESHPDRVDAMRELERLYRAQEREVFGEERTK